MKCRELIDMCDRLTAGILGFGGHAASVEIFAKILAVKPDQTAAQLAKTLSQLKIAPTGAHGDVVEVRKATSILLQMLAGVAKPAILTELRALNAAFERHEGLEVSELIRAIAAKNSSSSKTPPLQAREEIVRKYAAALESCLGDDPGFNTVYSALERDCEVQQAEAIALAKRFAFASTKTRPAALKKIWARHQSLIISRAKSAATAGRIAG